MINHMITVVFTTDILNYLANETGGEHESLMLTAIAAILTWSCAGAILSKYPTSPWKRQPKLSAGSDAPAIGRHRAQ